MSTELSRPLGQIEQEGRQTERFNFDGFAKIKEYRELNRNLVRGALEFLFQQPRNLRGPIIQIDVASGTGLVPQLTRDVLDDLALQTPLKSIGVEPDPFAIQKAKKNTPCTPRHAVEFIQGFGQELDNLIAGKIPSEGADLVNIHDALHEIRGEKDKRLTIRLMTQHLREGGIFTFNSAFTTTSMGNDSMQWGRWKFKAMELLRSKRDKEIPAIKIHTPQEYVDMITEAGLTVLYQGQKTIILTREALEYISRYPNFILGVFEDMVNTKNFSLAEKSQKLIDALEKLGIEQISRKWFEVIAQKSIPV